MQDTVQKETVLDAIQNKVLDKDNLAAKYADVKIGVIPFSPELKEAIGSGGFLSNDTVIKRQEVIRGIDTLTSTPIHFEVTLKMQYMPRSEAEVEISVLQPISYCVLEVGDRDSLKYFCTKRIGNAGDERLSGLYSIGVGGHVEDGESLTDAFYREMKEEVAVDTEDIFTVKRLGYIYDGSTEVGKVHLGFVFLVSLNHNNIMVKDTDKLTGEWVTMKQLDQFAKAGKLEKWSELCIDVLKKGIK